MSHEQEINAVASDHVGNQYLSGLSERGYDVVRRLRNGNHVITIT